MRPFIFLAPLALLLSIVTFHPARADDGYPVSVASPHPALALAAAAPAPHSVPVAEPAAPPVWAQELILAAQKLPVVGPFISKALLYLGILAAILTTLTGFLISISSALAGALKLAGLDHFVDAVKTFQGGKFMYWLKFFSMFNAKKPDPKLELEMEPKQ